MTFKDLEFKNVSHGVQALVDFDKYQLSIISSDMSYGGKAGLYEIGVFALYESTGLPVVPVALNSGLFWPRKSWLKYPGIVDIHFLEPIQPGLTRKQFMAKLEQQIESKMAVLDTLMPDNNRR